MSCFKEMLKCDLQTVFFNDDEFATEITIDNPSDRYLAPLSSLKWSIEAILSLKDFHFQWQRFNDDLLKPFKVLGFFDTNTEMIFDSGGDFAETAVDEPSVLLRRADADTVSHDSLLNIEGRRYRKNYENEEDLDLVRIYLEKRR